MQNAAVRRPLLGQPRGPALLDPRPHRAQRGILDDHGAWPFLGRAVALLDASGRAGEPVVIVMVVVAFMVIVMIVMAVVVVVTGRAGR